MFGRKKDEDFIKRAEQVNRLFAHDSLDEFIDEMTSLIAETADRNQKNMLYMSLAAGYAAKCDYKRARDTIMLVNGRKLGPQYFPVYISVAAYYDLMLGLNEEAVTILKRNEKMLSRAYSIGEVAKYTEYNSILIYLAKGRIETAEELLNQLEAQIGERDEITDCELAELKRKISEAENI